MVKANRILWESKAKEILRLKSTETKNDKADYLDPADGGTNDQQQQQEQSKHSEGAADNLSSNVNNNNNNNNNNFNKPKPKDIITIKQTNQNLSG